MKKNKLFISFAATKDMPRADYTLKKTLRAAVLETLLYEGFSGEASVSITVCDNAHIRKLNKQYRDIDRETDVLSFPLYDFECEDDMPEGESLPLGDIVISIERAKEQAKEIGHSTEHEAAFLCVHSTLHLLGYDHETGEEDEKEMFSRQRKIIDSMSDELSKFDNE